MKSVTKPCYVTYEECHEPAMSSPNRVQTLLQLFLLQQTLILHCSKQ